MSDPLDGGDLSCTRPRSWAATSTSATRSSFASATRSGGPPAHTRLRGRAAAALRAVGFDGLPARSAATTAGGRCSRSSRASRPSRRCRTETTSCPSSDACCADARRPGGVRPSAVAQWHVAAARPTWRRRRDLPQRHLPAERDLPRGASCGADRLGPGDPRAAPLRRRVGGQLLGAAPHDERARRSGFPERKGERLRLLCDGYGLERPSASRCSTSSRIATGWDTRSTGSTAASAGCPAGARCGTPAAATRS